MKLDPQSSAKLRKFLNKAQKDLEKEANNMTSKLGRSGASEAIKLAPIYSGETVKRIVAFPVSDNKFVIESRDSTPELKDFNLPVWLATSNRALTFIKSGDPRYMKKAANKINDEVENEVKKLIAKVFK